MALVGDIDVSSAVANARLKTGLQNVVTKTAAYTATVDDDVILVDTSGGAVTITLPPAADATNKVLEIVKTNTENNDVTVDGNSSETINGAANFLLEAQYDAIKIACDGTEWFILHEIAGQGGGHRLAKIAFGAAELGGTETNTSFIAPANGMVITDAFIYVGDGESGTMDVGTQGTSNDPDGILDAIVLTNTGWVFPSATHTTGSNADYLSASTYGALWMDIEIGADLATDIGYAIPRRTFITGGDPVSITSSGDLNSCSGYLFIEYIELPSVA